MTTARGALSTVVVALGAVLLYATYLTYAPIYLAHDEVMFGLNAHAIAQTGRDLNGERFPIVFRVIAHDGRYFMPPVTVYTTALFLRVLPLAEWSIRLPTALLGAADIVLIFLLARKLFRRDLFAYAAAALLALTPAHFIHARLASDTSYPVFFVLAWLYALLMFLDTDRLAWLVAAAMSLSVGLFSYLGSLVMMPLYFVLMLAVLWSRRTTRAAYAVAILAFSWPVVLMLSWFVVQPSRFGELLRLYDLSGEAGGAGPVRSVLRLFSYFSLSVRSGVYWDFFNPSMLFFSGDGSLLSSTRNVGVFLLPCAVLLPLGAYHILANRRTRLPLVVLAGFLTAPLAAVITLSVTIHRALALLPFGALVATYGVEWLWLQPRRWRAAGVCLLAALPLQFAWFYRDYMTDYRARSAFWFERDQRGAIAAVIAHEPKDHVVPVYVSSAILWIDANWKLYTQKAGRGDLLDRAVYFGPNQAASIPAGALVVSEGADPIVAGLLASGRMRELARVTEPDRQFSYVVAEVRRVP